MSAGALAVVTVWVVASALFRWYMTSLADFKTAIGSLTVLLFLMAYVFTSSVIFLIGVEIDELARQDAREVERGILDTLRGALG